MDCGKVVYDETAFVETRFNGIVIPDHVPEMRDDTDWGHRSRGYTAGYLCGLLNATTAD